MHQYRSAEFTTRKVFGGLTFVPMGRLRVYLQLLQMLLERSRSSFAALLFERCR